MPFIFYLINIHGVLLGIRKFVYLSLAIYLTMEQDIALVALDMMTEKIIFVLA